MAHGREAHSSLVYCSKLDESGLDKGARSVVSAAVAAGVSIYHVNLMARGLRRHDRQAKPSPRSRLAHSMAPTPSSKPSSRV